ncbi:hypothetical protein P4V39_22815 [Brevibacillus borstelensis]|uniref:hypothetical protein n=1 Tax=Brevibacillus borstelensis TaxID=45462 RepID=UPI002E1FF33A|nr:hypothetical protein [Brevibacillus borstelensis]
MFLGKLIDIYHSSGCNSLFPEYMVEQFEIFIKQNVRQGKKFISPYKFALDQNIDVKDSIRFFMFYTKNDGVLDISLFFNCSKHSCTSTIFVNKEILDEDQDYELCCVECGTEYDIETIAPFIKVYFQLKPDVIIPNTSEKLFNTDPNSTFEALRGLPSALKFNSPSSFTEQNLPDEGEQPSPPVTLQQIFDSDPMTRLSAKISGRSRGRR